ERDPAEEDAAEVDAEQDHQQDHRNGHHELGEALASAAESRVARSTISRTRATGACGHGGRHRPLSLRRRPFPSPCHWFGTATAGGTAPADLVPREAPAEAADQDSVAGDSSGSRTVNAAPRSAPVDSSRRSPPMA